MFVFAHVFLGALIGLGFWHLTQDRRALPLCIIGAILPDLIDKTLALLVPGLFGSGRTIGHSLLFFSIAVAAGILIWHYRHTLLGIAFACAIISHQIIDGMWNVPSTWYYPLMGPFPVFIIPDYVGHYFWLEVSSLSEWVFGCASLLIIALWYTGLPEHQMPFLTSRRITSARYISAVLLGVVGVCLLFSGLAAIPHGFAAPTYDPVTNAMAGLLALCGTVVLVKWSGSYHVI
jgi:hypothetical protein